MTGSEQDKSELVSTQLENEQGKSGFEPFAIGTEVDPDALFEQWAREDARNEALSLRQESERFTVGRHPLILAAIFIVSVVLAIYCYPALDAVIHEGEFDECGDVLTRALDRSKGTQTLPFYHQQRCQLSGMVGTPNLFAIGYQETPDSQDEFERNRGISYVVKLNGDHVYAILPAHPPEIEGYRLRNGSLFGLEINELGLMIDPRIATSYRHLEGELRVNLGIKAEERLWFFDVTYSPWDHKMPLATAIIAPLIALLSLIAIRRTMMYQRALEAAAQSDQEWLSAFEAAAQEAGLSGMSSENIDDRDEA